VARRRSGSLAAKAAATTNLTPSERAARARSVHTTGGRKKKVNALFHDDLTSPSPLNIIP
jgi:hypothetical protein